MLTVLICIAIAAFMSFVFNDSTPDAVWWASLFGFVICAISTFFMIVWAFSRIRQCMQKSIRIDLYESRDMLLKLKAEFIWLTVFGMILAAAPEKITPTWEGWNSGLVFFAALLFILSVLTQIHIGVTALSSRPKLVEEPLKKKL